jgi:hypothetical protein
MAHPWHHAISSQKKWGGEIEDYLFIHEWFDETKSHYGDPRHRALRHHSEGIFLCEQIFGKVIITSHGREIPVRWIGEQHVREDMNGWIPSAKDWLKCIQYQPWMNPQGKVEKEIFSFEEMFIKQNE